MTPDARRRHVLAAILLAALAGACAPAWETGETFGGRTVSAWIAEIGRDGSSRRELARSLEELGDEMPGAVRAFARVLDSGDEDERFAAILALGDMALHGDTVLPTLIKATRDPCELNRDTAASTIQMTFMPGQEDMPVLIGDLESPDADERLYAALLIGMFCKGNHRISVPPAEGGPQVEAEIAALVKALSDTDRDVRRCAAFALAELGTGGKPVTDRIVAALADPYAPVRAQAAYALEKILGGGDTSGLAISSIFDDSEEDDYEATAPDRDAAVLALLPLLEDSSDEVRYATANAIESLVPRNVLAVQPLARALTDTNQSVRWSAAHALYEMGALARPAIPDLTRALLGPDVLLRDTAASAIAAIICPDDVPPDAPKVSRLDVTIAVLALAGALRDEEELMRDSAVDALADIGLRARAAESALAERFERSGLDGTDVRTRLQIAQALEAVSPESAWTVGAFVDLLGATRPPDSRVEDEDIGRTAAWALAKRGRLSLGLLTKALASAAPHARASAASGLGWIARGRRLAPGGGFSDVPIGDEDPDAPPRPSAEAMARIVRLLTSLLGDTEAQVRAAAAHALGDVGGASAPSYEDICRALADPSAHVRRGAVWALEGLGPRAAAATSLVVDALDDADASVRIHAVMALDTIAPDSRDVTRALARRLGDDDYGVRYRAADALARRRRDAVDVLARALAEGNAHARGQAARALALIGNEAVAAGPALMGALDVDAGSDADEKVLCTVIDAVARVRPSPERAVPALLRLAGDDAGTRVRRGAMRALGAFGADARVALPLLTTALGNDDKRTSEAAVDGVAGIGADAAAARVLLELDLSDSEYEQVTVFKALARRPADALRFLGAHPGFLREAGSQGGFLVELLARTDAEGRELRRAVRARDDLPPTIMVRTGDRSFLPTIEERIKTASQHGHTLLTACARALRGGRSPGERVVAISPAEPGEFRPPSNADCDKRRMPRDVCGHGDGETDVVVTGRILMPDGRPATTPRFFNLNDRFMLGTRRKVPTEMAHSALTGRFVYVTSVFAAFAYGRGPREPGPYQTGSALVLIEADGAKSLRVRFFDEMPDVEITLPPAE